MLSPGCLFASPTIPGLRQSGNLIDQNLNVSCSQSCRKKASTVPVIPLVSGVSEETGSEGWAGDSCHDARGSHPNKRTFSWLRAACDTRSRTCARTRLTRPQACPVTCRRGRTRSGTSLPRACANRRAFAPSRHPQSLLCFGPRQTCAVDATKYSFDADKLKHTLRIRHPRTWKEGLQTWVETRVSGQ